jgi:Xaa-Pro aminopeptidase
MEAQVMAAIESDRRSARADRFSQEEYQRRYAVVRRRMRELGLDALIGFSTSAMPANVRYLTNFAPTGNGTAYLLFPLEGEPLLLVSIFSHVASARSLAVVPSDFAGLEPTATVERLASRLRDLGLAGSRIGLVELDSSRNRGLSVAFLDELKEQLPGIELSLFTAELELIRRVKSEEEIAVLRTAAGLAEQCLEAMAEAARPGGTERDLLAAVAGTAARLGGTLEVAFIGSTSMHNPSMAMPPILPSDRVLQQGDVILSELSIGYLGYSSQLLRPIVLGLPTGLYRELFDTAAAVYQAVQAVLRPGATGWDVQAAAAAIIPRAGFAAEAPIVHGWSQWSEYGFHISLPGSEAHWFQRPVEFQANMTLSVEPNPCTPDFRAGIFLGDLNVIGTDGAASVQSRPLQLIVV